MAGYGVDPGMAFDFGLATSPQQQATLPEGVTGVQFGGYQCANPVTCRDRVDAPDEVVFHSRDPLFGQLLTGHDASTLVLRGPLNRPLDKGQILQVVCYGGDQVWAYVTVDSRVEATTTNDVRVPLDGAQTAGDNSPIFPHQNTLLANPCFAAASRVFAIERYRYFVQSYDLAGAVVAWGTPESPPT
jgi:hypothetical protein